MRVGLNATCFNARPSGAKQRFEGIYGALIRNHPDIDFLIYEPRDFRAAELFRSAPNVLPVLTPLPSQGRLQRAIQGVSFWRRRLKKDRLNIFENFNLPLVQAPGCAIISTIHDARSALANRPRVSRALARHIHRDALRIADQVITVSDTMKQELLAIEPSANIVTIYNGLDPRPFTGTAPVRSPDLPPDYLLAVGHFEARKNYPRLIEALAILREARPGLALAIVGNDGGDLAAVRRQVELAGLGDAVRLLTDVGDDRLRAIYRAAQAVVFPSRYEGFGIPVLEAMAARRPLVTSNLPVFVELTQGKGAYFDPDDSAAMARVIAEVLDDPDRQRALIDDGVNRVADFGFDRLARQVRDVYRRVLTESEIRA